MIAHHKAKLTYADVELIRCAAEHRAGLLAEARLISNKALGDKFGVSVACVEKVLAYRSWRT